MENEYVAPGMPHYGNDSDYDDLDDPARDLADALHTHSKRSRRSRRTDDTRQAKPTTDVDEWKEDPDEYDFKGVDNDLQLDDL